LKDAKNTAPATPVRNKLLLLSFFEGASVMVAELAGGKMLAPYYGTSLYVWASTLAITLGALTIGYYLGGEWSKKMKEQRQKRLFLTLAIASGLVIVMPVLAKFVMEGTLEMSFLTGVVISQLVFLMPPVLGMGIVSPMLIGLIGENSDSGKAAGLVYAVSTLGGVIATLLTGFWLVPLVGIAIPCVVSGAILFLLNVLILRPNQKFAAGAVIILLIPSGLLIAQSRQNLTDKYKVLYHTEGMLGQVKIVDFDYESPRKKVKCRVMLVNHNWQTWVSREDNDFSFLYYTRFTRSIISSLPKDSRALLIGLGGGTVARQLEHFDVAYDAVEIDGRLPALAEKYFGLKTAVANTVVDDGRHYINVCKKKYDLIIIDALLGENIPSHLLSVECFDRLKTLLTDNGKIFVEFDGLGEDDDGIAQQMLFNTIKKAGYSCRIFSSSPKRMNYDLMYVATKDGSKNYDTAQILNDFYFPPHGPMNIFEANLTIETDGIITDNNQVIDFYLKDRMIGFREKYLLQFNEEFLDDRMVFFR
jgi:predicted membrane-bound spermidine synthase